MPTAAACVADRPLTAERLRALLAGARAGTLRRFFRSAPELPAHTADPGLVTVVGDSFDRLVTRQTRDVLLIAHSPGPCSDCARMLTELPRLSAANKPPIIRRYLLLPGQFRPSERCRELLRVALSFRGVVCVLGPPLCALWRAGDL